MMDSNKQWIIKGNTGCAFASIMAKKPELINWKTIVLPDKLIIPENCSILSLQFPGYTIRSVRKWALANGFYEENIEFECKINHPIGLRYKIADMVSWVMYIGPDMQIKTRCAPTPELIMCTKLQGQQYFKVLANGFYGDLYNGNLSLVHADITTLKNVDKLWDFSYKKTTKILGHIPSIENDFVTYLD